MKLLLKITLVLMLVISVGCDLTPPTTETTTTTTTDDTPVVSYFPVVATPSDTIVITNSVFKFSVAGGKPPYTFAISSGPGSINETLGVFSAGTITGNSIVEITDSANNTGTAKIKIVNPLALSPQNVQLNVSSSIQLEPSGGIPPYTYWITNGGGLISALGFYQAGPVASSGILAHVIDSKGNEATTSIDVRDPVSIIPSSIMINRGEQFQLSATNGFTPYVYRVVSGGGSVNASSGVFQSPSIAGITVVEVVDNIGKTSQASLTINNQSLHFEISNVYLQINQTKLLKAVGGLAPYIFSFDGTGNNGSLLASGAYFAPSFPTTDHVKITDSEGTIAYATINVSEALQISPTTKTTIVNRAEIFSVSGGISPYTFQIISGAGSIDPSTGVFIASSVPGNVTIRVRDSQGNTSDAVVTVNPDVLINPTNPILAVNNQINFLGSGGIPPYQYDLISGVGSIDQNTGLYSAGNIAGSATIRVTDSKNTTKTTTVTVNSALAFVENSIVVKAGNSKNILVTGGVPPYTLSFRDPNTLQLTNFSQYGSIIGSNNFSLGSSPLATTANSNIVIVTKIAHGLVNSEEILFSSLTACSNITSAKLNKNFIISVIDQDSFSIQLDQLVDTTTNCGGINGFYKRMSGSIPYRAGIVSQLVTETLVVRDSLQNEASQVVSIDGGLTGYFHLMYADGVSNKNGQTCVNQTLKNLTGNADATVANCTVANSSITNFFQGSGTNVDPFRFVFDPAHPLNLDFTLSTNKVATESNSIEMWVKWAGTRLSTSFSHFDSTLIGFSNYNLSFMTIKQSTTVYDKAICFNTKVTAPYDCFGFKNPDSYINDRWTHLVIVFNNGDMTQNKIYMNGVDQSLIQISTQPNGSVNVLTDNFKIGTGLLNATSSGGDVNNAQFDGSIGLIRIYNRKITSDEVTNNYNNTKDSFQYFGP